MSTATEVRVPDIGDFSDVPIIEVHVAPGDKVNAEDPLLTLESDKATLDVPAPSSGTVGEVLVKVGDQVSEGTPILMLSSGDGASTTPPSLVEQQEAGIVRRDDPLILARFVWAVVHGTAMLAVDGQLQGVDEHAETLNRYAIERLRTAIAAG